MEERELIFGNGPQRLVGTLCLPEAHRVADASAPHPGVLLLSGSGPLDRDSNHRRARFDVARQLAHALAAAGIISLRFDKRGVGDSPGDWRAAGLTDNIADAAAAYAELVAQPEVGAGFVLGHSEGALLAGAVAAARDDVAGLVLLAGAGRPGREVLLHQADTIIPTLPAPIRGLLRLFRVDAKAKVAANHRKLLRTTTDVARLNGAKVNARWFREYLPYDPADDLARVTVPVLAITGTKDLQVDPAELQPIEEATAGPVTTHRLDDLTHTLRRQPGAPSVRKYRAELRRPVDPELLTLLTDWVGEVARADRGSD